MQALHVAWPVASCHWPPGQPAHEPNPAWPAGQFAQLCLLEATAQPLPLLQAFWLPWFCHQFDGQSLQLACPPWFWNLPAPHPGHEPFPAVPAGHDAQLCLLEATAQPLPLLQAFWLPWFCHQLDGQSLQLACPPWFWNLPAPHPGHEPVPAWPAGHDAQDDLPPLTAQPDPLLQPDNVCDVLSCQVLEGHAPQTMLLSASQAAVCF